MSAQPHITDHDEGIPSYLSRLTQVPLLKAEEEAELARAVQAGCQKARCRLIESNMRLVINIAKSYRNLAIPLEDLIQEGAIGLMQAAERFDPAREYRFSTYATYWVRQAIGRAIDNKSKSIRLPAHITQSIRRIEKERVRLSRELGCEPSPDQIAAALGISPKRFQTLVQCSQELLSLDMQVGEGGGMTLGGLIRDDVNEDPEAAMLSQETIRELQRILLELNDREQRVMKLRFRMDGTESSLQDDIAKDLKLSRERVRQIELQAIKKLRALAQRRRLGEILGR